MGEVLVALDQSTGRRVALKRMLDGCDGRMSGMFEREYHSLRSLKHPRIIEVYDYGFDQGQPYYTMELLDGDDLRKAAPAPYLRACAYLRDIASSLALLHARKLLHRDVSARNVCVTSDGRCKLIDFGTMASFGVPDVIVGTPAFMAPEVLQRTALDQRCDLFSLGAVGYWLLTGKNAFPAHNARDLPQLWRNAPKPPSEVIKSSEETQLDPIPPALDELILSLLTSNPLGRPTSAVEVIERLTTIAKLESEPEHEQLSARSYLHSGAIIGRGRERERIAKRLEGAIGGKGAAIVLDAVAGVGSSHLMTNAVLDAQLAGATAVFIDAQLHRGVYGLAHALVESLLVVLPEESLAAAQPYARALCRFSPLLAARLPASLEQEQLPPGELRRRTQTALSEWIFAVAARHPLMLAIDNVQRADEGSAALLATLAHGANGCALLVLVTQKSSESPLSAAALRTLIDSALTIRLRTLSRDDVHGLVCSLFGPVDNTGRLATWLNQISGGSPRTCMDLVHHLVDARVIRFVEGVWVLPQELLPSELPATLDQVLEARVERLSSNAVQLVEALCVHHGAMPIERCLAIAAAEGIADPLAALQELAAENVLVQTGASYHFEYERVRERLYARLSGARRQRYHEHFGRLMSDQADTDVNTKLEAGWHLLNGGAESEGAELLAGVGTVLAYTHDEFSAAVPALSAALRVFRAQGRSRRQIVRLLGPLAVAGYRVDHRLATEHGDEAVDMLQDLIGLKLAARLRPVLGKRLSLYLGLAFGLIRALIARGRAGIAEFQHLITTLFLCATSLTGTATICLDAARARKYAKVTEHLTALGKDHAASISHEFAQVLAMLPEQRIVEVVEGCKRLAERFEDTSRPIKALPVDSRTLMHGGIYYALAAMCCSCDGADALRYADKLDSFGLKLYAMAADQVRTTYHALRGESALAERYRERVNMHALQAGTAWQVEIWAPSASSQAYTLTRDVIGTKHIVEVLDRIVAQVPTLQRQAQLARCTLYQRKGNLQLAYDMRQGVLDANPPRSFLGWSASVGAQVQTLVELGRPLEAKRLAKQFFDLTTDAEQAHFALYQQAHVGLIEAELALGEYESARHRIEGLIEKHAPNEGPVTLGTFHMLGVRTALAMHDPTAARMHMAEVERWFRPTGNPALISQCERLSREVWRFLRESPDTSPSVEDMPPEDVGTIRSMFKDGDTPSEVAERALAIIVKRTRAVGGFLFKYDAADRKLRLSAPLNGDEPPTQLVDALQVAIEQADREETWETVTVMDSANATEQASTDLASSIYQVGKSVYRPFVLEFAHKATRKIVAVAAVEELGATTITPALQVLEGVARALHELSREDSVQVEIPPIAASRSSVQEVS